MARFSSNGVAGELLAIMAKEAPSLQFQFRMRPEVAARKGTSVEGCNYVRAIGLRNGEWIIIGLVESEAKAGDLPPVFQVMFHRPGIPLDTHLGTIP